MQPSPHLRRALQGCRAHTNPCGRPARHDDGPFSLAPRASQDPRPASERRERFGARRGLRRLEMRLGCAVDAAQAPCRGMVVRSSIGTMSISSRVPACAGELPVRRTRRALDTPPCVAASAAAGRRTGRWGRSMGRVTSCTVRAVRPDRAGRAARPRARTRGPRRPAHARRQGRPYRRLRKRQPSTSYPTLRRAAVLSHHAALMELSARLTHSGGRTGLGHRPAHAPLLCAIKSDLHDWGSGGGDRRDRDRVCGCPRRQCRAATAAVERL